MAKNDFERFLNSNKKKILFGGGYNQEYVLTCFIRWERK